MNSIVKQRLVGALVLIALGVVFWPIIFVPTPNEESLQLPSMPARPEFDRTPIPTPTSRRAEIEAQLPSLPDQGALAVAADVATALPAESSSENTQLQSQTMALKPAADLDPPTPRTTAPVVRPVDEQGLALAWVLQVATVSSESRAQSLLEQLKKRAYPAFIQQTKNGDKVLYRIKIGPKVERAKLDPIKAEVDALLKVNAVILRYVQ
jgi:DedD protein